MKRIIIVLSICAVSWAHPAKLGVYGNYDSEEETPGHLDDTFQFAYAVASPEHGTYHGHQSTRDENGHTSGSYYSLGADGHWRQTIYSDKGLGFQALSNQRPSGSPPPQVSSVSYQIFVHPGSTAISSSGSGPIDTAALLGQSVTSFASADEQPSAAGFDIRTAGFGSESGSEGESDGSSSGGSTGADAGAFSASTASQTASSASSSVQQSAPGPITIGTPAPTPGNIAFQPVSQPAINVQSASSASSSVQQSAPGPINIGTPAPTPGNIAFQPVSQPAINVQSVQQVPIRISTQSAGAPTFNVQSTRPSPVNVQFQAAPAPVINAQVARPSPINVGIRKPAPSPILLQGARPLPVNVAVLNSAPQPINIQGPVRSPVNVAVQRFPTAPVALQGAALSPVNFNVLGSAGKPITLQGAAKPAVNFAVRGLNAGSIGGFGGGGELGRGLIAAKTGFLGSSGGKNPQGISFGTRLS